MTQNRSGSAPLIAGKSTVARIFLQGAGNGGRDISSGISGSLAADGMPETLKPFGDTAIAPAGAPDPDNQRHSLNFMLPLSWTRPGAALQVRASARLNTAPEKVQTATATFQPAPGWPPVFRVLHLEFCAPDAAGLRQCAGDPGDVSGLLQSALPLPDGGVEYNPVAAAAIEWPRVLSSIDLTRFLLSYYYLLEPATAVDYLHAWVPGTGSGGHGRVSWTGVNQNAAQQLAAAVARNLGLRADASAGPGGFDIRAAKVVPGATPDLTAGGWPSVAAFQGLFYANAASPPKSEPSDYLVIGGRVLPDGSAQLEPGFRVNSSFPGEPSDPAAAYCLRFSGGAAADYCFTPFFPETAEPAGAGGFEVKAPLPAGTTRVALVLRDSGAELSSLQVNGGAPALSIVNPQAGDIWQGKRLLQWTSADAVYAVQYSADNGNSWTPLAIGIQDTQFEVDGVRISGGPQVLFRVLASKGIETAAAVTGPVTVTQRPQLTFDQTALEFLNGTVGQSSDRTLLLANSGSGPLTASGRIAPGQFQVLSGSGPLLIPAEGQRAIAVRWSPTSTGAQQGVLELTSGDASLPDLRIPLTGQAFDNPVPAIRLSTSALAFGTLNSGQTKDLRFTVSNNGLSPLTLNAITSSSPRFSVTAPALPLSIQAGQSADVTIRFAPNTAGAVSATLSIPSNDPSRSTVTLALTGTGTAGPSPSISITPQSLDFGGVTTGQTRDLKLTVSNTGSAELAVRSIAVAGALFALISPPPSVNIAAGGSVDYTVRFSPALPGAASGSLTITSSDAARPSVTVALTGQGVAPAVSSILRTITYHEITSLAAPPDLYNWPAISRNGARAFFTMRTNELWVVNTDGSGLRRIDTDATANAHYFSVSDDGAKALVWNASFLRVVNVDGSSATVLASPDGAVQAARLSGDGRTIVFVNSHNAGNLTVSSGSRLGDRGVWAINSDGSSLRQLASGRDAAAALNVPDITRMVSDSPFPSGIEVSSNGSRIVFGVETAGKGRCIMGVNGDGSALHVIRSGLGSLFVTAISADGATVGYSGAPQPGAPSELAVIRFDGTAGQTLATGFGHFAIQLSNDGSMIFAGGLGSGLLFRTDGSLLVQLFAPLVGNATQLAVGNAANRSGMAGDGTRFLFTAPSAGGGVQFAIAEINPANTGAAPSIVNPTVDPASVPGDGSGYRATITAGITSAAPVIATVQAFLQGLPDQAGSIMSETGGGPWAGSIFFSTTASGARVMRVKAETQVDGRRHATAIDFGGFAVNPR
ncbi:MAG TPA: choice-of-anchor D domain-containing protein [Bryobacteraceae bacterium]|nr:choice-of-anchor D domain-containing protein [Bryobacteraceae bacterium]